MKYFKYFLVYFLLTYTVVTTIGEAAVKIMNYIAIYIMKYIVEKSDFYMLRNFKSYTYADSLRHGVVSRCKDYTKLYDINSRDMKNKIFKQIRSLKAVTHEAKPSTQTKNVAARGRPKTKAQAEQNPKPKARRRKYVQIIPHDTVPGNYLILEIKLS